MNLVTMRTRLRKRIGNPSTGDVPDTELDELLNEAYQEIGDQFRFRATRGLVTFPTIASSSDYALPTNLLVVIRISNITSKINLRKRSAGWGDVQDSTVLATPTDYVMYRDWLRLFSTPDGVYTVQLYYKAALALLIDNTDTPLIPSTWHPGIILLARFKFYDARTAVAKAQYANRVWKDWVAMKPEELDDEMQYDPDGVGVEIPTLSRSAERRLDFDHAD